jgi:hypothetical protein
MKTIYKNYTEKDALDLVENRYKNMKGKLVLTIQRLSEEKDFEAVFNKLKSKGYPDWAIYMAVMNLVYNFRINRLQSDFSTPQEYHALWQEFLSRPEKETDLEVPVSEFTEEKLEFAIDMYVTSFLKGQGYEFRKEAPNIKKLRKFAEEKYKIFEQDVEHEKWFSFEQS